MKQNREDIPFEYAIVLPQTGSVRNVRDACMP